MLAETPVTFSEITSQLSDYQNIYRKIAEPPLELSSFYDLFPENPAVCDLNWPDEWPHSGEAGVYFIFDEKKQLIYIGKASWNSCIGARLSTYFKWDKNKVGCMIVHEWLLAKPRFVASLKVTQEHRHEAAAIEEYLITKFAKRPLENKIGKY